MGEQMNEGGPRLNGRADERVPNMDAGRTDIVWGTVNDGPICHCRTPPPPPCTPSQIVCFSEVARQMTCQMFTELRLFPGHLLGRLEGVASDG